MKEWCIKHPVLTFFLADSAIAGIVNIIRAVAGAFSGNSCVETSSEVSVTNEAEEDDNE